MKTRIVAILIISAVTISFASSHVAKKSANKNEVTVVKKKHSKSAGFVSEEI